MTSMDGYVYFNSGNINSLVEISTEKVRPNMNYIVSINQPDIDHLKSDNTVSGISEKSSKVINGTLTTTFTTPADNIVSDIEIVRNVSGNVDVYVRANMGSSNYPNLTYTGNLRAYSDPGLITVVKQDVFDFNNTESSRLNINIPGFTTEYYFAADFTNTTHNLDVYTNQSKSVRQKNQVFDIRGLAYFRDGLYKNPVVEELPYILHGYQQSPIRYALSADGTVMLSTVNKYIYIYKHRKKIDVYEPSDASGWNFNTYGKRYGHLYSDINYAHIRGTGNAVAISGDSRRCVVAYLITSGSVLRVIDINVDLTFGNNKTDLVVPVVYNTNYVHNVCMSMDGNTILISGCKADLKEGYAHVYNYNGTAWSAGIDLSSITITGYDSQYSYGTDSCLSGDGKTIVIFGGPITGSGVTNSGYVWKFNNFTQVWDFFQTLSFSYSLRLAPCGMSHYGDTLLVTAPNENKWVVFEYDKSVNRFLKVPETENAVTSGFRMASGSISGDGNTIVYVEIPDPVNSAIPVNVYVYTKTTGVWAKSHTIEPRLSRFQYDNPFHILTLLVSFDGGIVLLGTTIVETGVNMVTHINGKKTGTTITSAFDYLNESSNYGFIDYQYIPTVDWSIIPSETNFNRAEPNYGTVDALSMSAYGNMIIVGSPETNQAYLYKNDGSLIHTFRGSNRFGIRCSMDDNGRIVVIASNTRLYIYDGSTYGRINIIELSYGSGTSESVVESPWNMKISKDGSTIIASDNVYSFSFDAWTTTDTWSIVNGPVKYNSSSNVQPVCAIDLSVNGSVMIASGFNRDGDEGYVHLFSRGTSRHTDNVVIPGIVIGQSIALSGDGKKAILGCPNLVTIESRSVQVYFIDIDGTSMNPPISKTFSGTINARYGRSVSMDYYGRYAMVSGSMTEYRYIPSVGDNASGSAIVIDTFTYTIARELRKTSVTYQSTPTFRPDLNGYGVHCKLSSYGDVAAVSGGGYAFLFTYNNTSTQATRDSFGSGWAEIKYLPTGSTRWFSGNDKLFGYGGTEFLFTTGDFSRWLICDQPQVNRGFYYNADRTIKKSSISASSYQAKWYNRYGIREDPWISLEDHSSSIVSNTIMYGNESDHHLGSIHPTGMYVFVR